MIIPIPFNENAKQENARDFSTKEKIQEFLKMKYSGGYHFGGDELARNGQYREMAFLYNFRPFLKKYLIRQYDGYYHGYARNKGEMRKVLHLSQKDKVLNFPEN